MTSTPPALALAERRPVVLAFRAVLVVLAVAGLANLLGSALNDSEPSDLAINLVAAERLADRQPLYEMEESRQRAVELGGEGLAHLYQDPTSSFAGPPTTALLHLPYTLLDHDLGVAAFRVSTIAGIVAALALVARALPAGCRLDGFLVGVAAFAVSPASDETMAQGQGHHLVMLGLALALWATARRRWGLVGAGLGLAAALKLTPALLIVYLVARGHRRVAVGALGAVVPLVVAAAAIGGRPGDLLTWARDVAPELSRGVVRAGNQSLPAALARLTAAPADVAGAASLGAVRLIALPLLLAGAVALWRARRHRPVDPLELAVLVLLGLVLGPLTWVHYATWATLAVVLLVPRVTTEARLVGLLIAVALLALPVDRPRPQAVAEDWLLRVTPNVGLAAVAVLLALAVLTLAPGRDRAG
ncbi:MAG TPA: glycosyltransferase family 87 protein [Iamia sp.]|nr:glycosyltransferase family 87 protein [Iamia sp.]